MIRDILKSDRVKGNITILGREEGCEWFLIERRRNALVANAVTIIANALAGNSGWKIDRIRAMKASSTLAIQTTSFTFPSPNQVQFEAIFTLSSFNDTLDEVRLLSNTGGEFSIVTGLSVNKPNTLELSIRWIITVL